MLNSKTLSNKNSSLFTAYSNWSGGSPAVQSAAEQAAESVCCVTCAEHGRKQ